MSVTPSTITDAERAELAAAIARVEASLDESSRAVATYVLAMARATAALIEAGILLRGLNGRAR